MNEIELKIATLLRKVKNLSNPDIILLRQKTVIQWLYGDLSFLEKQKDSKLLEDAWGRSITRLARPDLILNSQWTGPFGERIAIELYLIRGINVRKNTIKINGDLPDLVTEEAIVEVKTQTFFTEGTAGEKIMGVPWKYYDVPVNFNKPLHILAIGRIEQLCRGKYKLLSEQNDDITGRNRQEYLDFIRTKGIQFKGATDLLNEFLDVC
jgi:hypothetical protein